MKWKPDNIEEFVRYKLQHPEESFITLKNYEAEKKHNQQIDQLHQELTKSRSELNHFKSELFKLNQASSNQIALTSEEIQRYDQKIDFLGDKFTKARSLSGISSKQRKKLMMMEYEDKINKLKRQHSEETIKMKNETERVRRKIDEEMNGNKRIFILERTEIAKSRLDEKLRQRETMRHRNNIVSELFKRYDSIKESVNNMRQRLLIRKMDKEKTQIQIQQIKNNLFKEMISRLEKFKQQFIILINSQSCTLSSEELLGPISSPQTSSNGDGKLIEAKQKLSESIQTLREYLMRLEYHITNNLNSTTLSTHTDKELYLQQISTLFQSSKAYVQQFSQINQFRELPQFQALEKQTLNLQKHILELKIKSDQFFTHQQRQFQADCSKLQSKQKQLDKEISQLQAKVTKTDLEIHKFIKNKP